MQTQFRRARLPQEIRSLMIFDHKAFSKYPADWFHRDDWQACDSWWMIIEKTKVGCCAFEPHIDFQQDVSEDGRNTPLKGSLYIVTTGILPSFQGQGFGSLLKQWQLTFARRHGFTRVVTNTRQTNSAMLKLNQRFGFTILRTTPDYYEAPLEPTVVMERLL
jgi:ribosomal protein S18 acetylase RimI-like enzyme